MVQNAIVRVLPLALGFFVTGEISLNDGYGCDQERKTNATMVLGGIYIA